MSKIDLTSPEWCELVFQNRNRSYGAFKLRTDSKKRHAWAMMSVILIALFASAIPTLVKYATPEKVVEKMVGVAVLSQLEEAEVKQDEFKRLDPVAPPPALKSSIKFTAPVIKKDEEVVEEDEPREMTKADMQREQIVRALRRNGGSRRAAAAELFMSERTLYRKIKELNIEE